MAKTLTWFVYGLDGFGACNFLLVQVILRPDIELSDGLLCISLGSRPILRLNPNKHLTTIRLCIKCDADRLVGV